MLDQDHNLYHLQSELARRSLLEYANLQWPAYRAARHHHQIAEALEAVEAGKIKRLMIFAPPRHGKSLLTSEYFPAWFLGRNPTSYIIHATYAQELAEDWGRKVRNAMSDDRWPFPDCRLSQDSASQKRLNTTAGGSYFALGVGGAATGRGAHVLIVDDPLKGRQEADSPLIRNRLKDWYKAVAYTRLMPDGAVICINTRWHHDDLSGWLLREHSSEGWHVLSLPAISESGEALWPEDYPIERLNEIKEQIGSREWAALYQQNPTPEEGSVFQLHWFRRYQNAPQIRTRIHSWDTGTKDQELNDPSVCQLWAQTGTDYYLADLFRQRLQFPELLRAIKSLAERDNPQAILIEDKGSGQQAIQVLRKETSLPIIGINPTASKTHRAQGISGLVESGRVWLPESSSWLTDFEIEIGQFPASAHDDQVDALSQALTYLRDRPILEPVEEAKPTWQAIPTAGAF